MNRNGFTLIELLIVVVIIGILAAIALPKFAGIKEKAYVASMKSDLRNLVTAEEAYYTDSLQYTDQTDCGNPPAGGSAAWCVSQGNVLARLRLSPGHRVGWSARVTNPNTSKSCAIYVGDVNNPEDPATSADPDGAPVCR
jgi:prepilin-type N-terminal cleavage/methylation domain-containing protein